MESPEKILMVDDEPNVLLGYQRLLRTRFVTETAVGSVAALRAIQNQGPFAVVLSDMRMPEMDGIQLLTKMKSLAPDTVRIMLTGYADVNTALSAVNEGNIFRLLTKPCTKEVLTNALTDALNQYRLVKSERDLLEKTLTGSLTVLTEVLSMASPAAFSRSLRLWRYMSHIINTLSLPNKWKFEVAAMLSQLGCLTMVPETIESIYAGDQVTAKEQALYETHPKITRDLLKHIPRMDTVAWMIEHQAQESGADYDINDRELVEMRLGAELLSVTLEFDSLVRGGSSRSEAASRVMKSHRNLDSRIPMALVEVEPEENEKEVRACRIEEIASGMVVEREVRTEKGALVAARGQEITPSVILKLKNYYEKGLIIGDISVSVLSAAASASK